MSDRKLGAKEAALRAQREANYAASLKQTRKPSAAELRNQVAKIKGGGKPKRGGGRGR